MENQLPVTSPISQDTKNMALLIWIGTLFSVSSPA